jgi:hypothetical protein
MASLLLWLTASWLGQVWGAALVLLRAAGRPVTASGALALVRESLGLWLLVGLGRISLVYGPPALLVAVAQSLQARGVERAPALPMATLVVGSLAVVLALLTALAAPVAVADMPRSPARVLVLARRWGDAVLPALACWGAVVVGLSWLCSLVPVGGAWQILPNPLVGSIAWVLLPVLYLRARAAAEPEALATRLGELAHAP